MVLAFDFFVTLTDHPEIRSLALSRGLAGDSIHIVSAISPGLPLDNDKFYLGKLKEWGFLGIDVVVHRVDHVAAEKVRVLREIGANAFWDDTLEYVTAARDVGIPSCHVGKEPPSVVWFAV